MSPFFQSDLAGTVEWFRSLLGFEAKEQTSVETPSSGIRKLYPKSDGWYDKDSSGTETKIGSGTGSGLPDTFTGTAGEALSQYDVVYANSSDSGELWIATNDGTAVQADAIGIITESGGISDTATGEVTRLGPITNAGWSWTPGATLWLGVDGAISETMPSAGSYAKPLGYAETATTIWFAPQNGWLVGFDVELSEVPPINDGRITLVSSSQIKWDGYRISLWNPTEGKDVEVIPSNTPVLNYNANDLDSNALVAAYPYDIFAEYSSATALNLVAKKWTNATTRAVSPALWHGRYRYDNTTDAGKKRLWIGIVYLATGPIFADSASNRFILNVYNKEYKWFQHENTYSTDTSHSVSSSWTGFNQSSSEWLIAGVFDGATRLELIAQAAVYASSASSAGDISIAVDSTNTPSSKATRGEIWSSSGGVVTNTVSVYRDTPSAGYHYFLPIQTNMGSYSGTIRYYLVSTLQSGFGGRVLC